MPHAPEAPIPVRLPTLLLAALLLHPVVAAAQPAPDDVRQLVTFRWQPGRDRDALAIYTGPLRAIYARLPALAAVRGFREAESPEPLDLVVVAHYRSMARMDTANTQLRSEREADRPALQYYADLAAMSAGHHDQFVRMLPELSDRITSPTPLTVYEFLRLAPGARREFEQRLSTVVRPAERRRTPAHAVETGRFLVADGWDILRIHHITSLGDWQRIAEARDRDSALGFAERFVAARKVMLLKHVPAMDVR